MLFSGAFGFFGCSCVAACTRYVSPKVRVSRFAGFTATAGIRCRDKACADARSLSFSHRCDLLIVGCEA
uniref:Putative secreted protein n=1 Tax=Anopheles triannulatus TaxID=58253 RepID=A0A2M4B591_9DIPT